MRTYGPPPVLTVPGRRGKVKFTPFPEEILMRRRIAAAILTALMAVGVTAGLAAAAAPASATDELCC